MQLHTVTNYTLDRYDFLKKVEGEPADTAGHVYIYADSEGIPTMGIGINLRVHGNLVLQTLGFDIAGTALIGEALIAENGYIAELRQAFGRSYASGADINNAAHTALSAILARRAEDSRYSAFPAFPRTIDFAFDNTTDSKAVFDTVMDGYPRFAGYEAQLNNWLSRNNIAAIGASKERTALISLTFNNAGALLGSKLAAALKNDDRAEAWYEIRYNSNADIVNAKRRFYEADTFGLYNDATAMSDADAKGAFRTYTRHKSTIDNYESTYSTALNNAISEFGGSVQSLLAWQQPARVYLVQQYVTTPGFGISITGDILVGEDATTLYYGHTDKDILTGTSQNDLIFGESGVDLLRGNGGDDVVYGGDGGDLLDGGIGSDQLIGGGGNDLYILRPGFGTVTITDADQLGKLVYEGANGAIALTGGHKRAGETNYRSIDDRVTYTLAGGTLMIEIAGDAGRVVINNYTPSAVGIYLEHVWTYSDGTTYPWPPQPHSGITFTNGPDFFEPFPLARIGSGSLAGGAGRDDLAGGQQSNIIDGGADDDLIRGFETWDYDNDGLSDYLFIDPDIIRAGGGKDLVTKIADGSIVQGGSGEDVLSAASGFFLFVSANSAIPARNVWEDFSPFFMPYFDRTIYSGPSGYLEPYFGIHSNNFSAEGASIAGNGWRFRLEITNGFVNMLYDKPNEGGECESFLRTSEDNLVDVEPGARYDHGVTLQGDEGDDMVVGASGPDSLDGGTGADYLFGNAGDDVLDGGTGNYKDILVGGDGNDALYGYGGVDELIGETGNDWLFGGDDDDTLFGDTSVPPLATLTGDDYLEGGAGKDTLVGGMGDDVLDGGTEDDTLFGGGGADTILGGEGDDQLVGNDGADFIDGGHGDDKIYTDSFDTVVRRSDGGFDNIYNINSMDGIGTIVVDGMDTSTAAIYQHQTELIIASSATEGVAIHGGLADKGQDYVIGDVSLTHREVMQLVSSPLAIVGSAAAETFYGGINHDSIDGSAGADTLSGGDGDDEIFGGDDNDMLYGDAGDDLLDGGLGSDIIYFDRGGGWDSVVVLNDTAAGKVDTLHFADEITPEDVILNRSSDDLALVLSGGTDKVTLHDYFYAPDSTGRMDRIEFADGTVWDETAILQRTTLYIITLSHDKIDGTWLSEDLDGLTGNDDIDGMSGNDTLRGGAGDDVLAGGLGDDTLLGGSGDDRIYGFSNPDGIPRGADPRGADLIQGGPGHDTLYGSDGNVTYIFSRGDDYDLIYEGTGSNDVLRFGAGILPQNITLYRTEDGVGFSELTLVIDGSNQQVTLENYFSGDFGIEHIEFDNGAGPVWSNSEIAALPINAGAQNAMTGTPGNDVFTVDHEHDAIAESVNGGVDTVNASRSFILRDNVENLTLTGPLNTNAIGNVLDNVLRGNSGDNFFDGGGGTDTAYGGVGNDTYQNIAAIVEKPGEGIDTAIAPRSPSGVFRLPDNVENGVMVEIGGSTQRLIGNELKNTLIAKGRPNTSNISYVLDGGIGADTMIAEVSNVNFYVDNPGDLVIAAPSHGQHQIVYAYIDAYRLPDFVDELRLLGDAAVSGYGNDRNNTLLHEGINQISNRFYGGKGDDIYILNAGDTAIELEGEGQDRIVLSGPTTDFVGITEYSLVATPYIEELDLREAVYGYLKINGIGNDADNVLYGNLANNRLEGGLGDDRLVDDVGLDTLDGGAGNDTLIAGLHDDIVIGGSGNDTLDGGTGNDTYLFASGFGQDVINNYDESADTDRIKFAATISPADVLLSKSGDDLVLRINGTTDQIKISNYFAPFVTFLTPYQIEQITFDDGTLWNRTAIDARIAANNTNVPTEGIDTLTGTLGNDTISSLGGDDTVSGDVGNDTLNGGLGNDTLFGNAGDDPLNGQEGNDTLYGHAGNDALSGDSGNDTLYGDVGNDTYVWGRGSGQDVVYDHDYTTADDTDTIQMAAGVLPADVSVSRSDFGLVLKINGALDQLTVEGFFASTENEIERVVFADGTIWDSATLKSMAAIIRGTDAPETLQGSPGDDTLYGLGGNDTLYAVAGNDLLNGGTGADALDGGTGNDTYIIDNVGDVVGESTNAGTDTVQSSFTYTLGSHVENLTLTGTTAINGTGNTLNNILTGNSANNTLNGGAGADTMAGGVGNDIYVVNASGDSVTENANEGTDTVQSSITYTLGNNVENLTLLGTTTLNATGNALNNLLTGNSANNVLTGGAGNDTLNGRLGADTLIGGLGNDIHVFNSADDVITENLNEGTDTVQSALSYTLNANLENLALTGTAAINGTGNTLDNVLTGNSASNVLAGGAGNDTYVVNTPGDTVIEALGAGTDSVQSSFTYTLGSHVENLTLTGTTAINGTGNTLDNLITGNNVNNVLLGDLGNDTLIGAAGNDTLNGGSGADSLSGGSGDDIYIVADSGDSVVELVSEGTDTVQSSISYTLGANVENVTLTGTAAINGTGNTLSNVVTGNSAANTLMGGVGNDTLIGGAGSDLLDGGADVDVLSAGVGDDIYIVDNPSDSIVENPNEGTDTVQSAASYTLGANLENLTLTGTNAINGTGNSLNNVITGNSAANTLTGGAGDDTYVLSPGDTAVENANEGTDTVQSAVTYTLGANVENLTLTGTAAINGTGNSLNNIITGNSAANTLTGGTGDDTYVLSAGDTAVENANEGIDTLHSTITYTLGGNFENLTLTGAAAINGTGNSVNNVLTGNSATNVLTGGTGNDTLDGGSGADTLIGGLGDDRYIVDNAGDGVTENVNEGTDTVQSSMTYTLGNNLENLTLTGTGTINGTGNSVNNVLIGNSATNVLNGGAGADTLSGGLGNDHYVVDHVGDSVVELVSEGTDTVSSSLAYTLGANVENLSLVGPQAINGTGNSLNNTLTGNTANNVLTGGLGNDTYVFGRGSKQDTLQDNDATAGNRDTAAISVNPLDIVFSRASSDLSVNLHGGTDKLTVQSWYSGTANQTETFKAADGRALLNTQVDQLIQAMATFGANNGGISWDQAIDQRPNEVQVVISAYWQAA